MIEYQFFLDEFFHCLDFLQNRKLFLFNELKIIFILLLHTVLNALSNIEGLVVALHHFILFHQNSSCDQDIECVVNSSADVLFLFKILEVATVLV